MRTLAIGDVHGCFTALRTLLEAVQPGPGDVLVTLGDYVDRGPDSKRVLETLLDLEGRTQLKPLIGNHEILFLDVQAGRLAADNWLQVGGRETLLSYHPDSQQAWRSIPQAHLDFLSQRCLRYWETPTHLFVHANANAFLPMEEQTDDWLFWTRFNDAFPHMSGKVMVCGHTAQRSGLPNVLPHAVCLDTWAYGEGWLTCLDLSQNLFIQANQSGQLRQLSLQEVMASNAPGSAACPPCR